MKINRHYFIKSKIHQHEELKEIVDYNKKISDMMGINEAIEKFMNVRGHKEFKDLFIHDAHKLIYICNNLKNRYMRLERTRDANIDDYYCPLDSSECY